MGNNKGRLIICLFEFIQYMKKLLSFLFLFFTVAAIAQNIPQRPNPPRLVNDFANVLTSDQIQSLEQKLVSYDDSTSNQIVIVTVPTVGDYDVDAYALKILRDWGVGNKKNNNGIVILVATNDRKVRIEVGYGLEGAVPDITAKQIIDNEITPYFRGSNQDNYYRGLDNAINAIIKAATGEYKAPENYNKRATSNGRGGSIFSWLIPLIIIILIFSRRGGGGGGGMMSRRGYNPFLGGLLGGILGGNIGRGGGGWSGGGGGGWSGGGGGGGFGGFGGGSGGGGGASGSW